MAFGQRQLSRRYRGCPVGAQLMPVEVKSLSVYFDFLNSTLSVPSTRTWFRGHSDLRWSLTPSALRYSTRAEREKALSLLDEFRRICDIRIERPPGSEQRLEWMQLAQHYGLPTRLLDWTVNAAIALFFACQYHQGTDGMVFVLDPIELNENGDSGLSGIVDPQVDARLVDPYLKLHAAETRRGRPTIAINPILNSQRIMLQRGTFTLHGSRRFGLDRSQAPSLKYLPILRNYKGILCAQLGKIGVDEMSIFPEPEHVSVHLKRTANLL